MKKPQEYDNSFLGIVGEGLASLYDISGNIIGTCLDTPNCVSYAMLTNKEIATAKGLLGVRDRSITINRMHVLNEKEYFINHITIF